MEGVGEGRDRQRQPGGQDPIPSEVVQGQGRQGRAEGRSAKGKSKASSKATKAKPAAVEQAPSKVQGAHLPKGPNKTAFIKEALGRDATLDAKGIKRAWTEAGNEGSISDNLFYTTKAAMGIKGSQDSSRSTEVIAARPEPASPSEASKPDRPEAAPWATPRTASSPGGHDRELHGIEAEIDELVFRLRGLGGYAEVQEALRAARRLLVRSHEA